MVFGAVVFLTLILDQAVKFFVVEQMRLHESIPVIPNIFHITYMKNPGGAFGLLPHQTSFFIIVTILLVVFIFFCYRYLPQRYTLLRIGLAFQMGGAFGNLVDRLRIGYVIDFFDFRVWPIFNIADMVIVIGALMIIYDLRSKWQDEEVG